MSLHQLFLDDQVLAAETSAEFLLHTNPQDRQHIKALRLHEGEHVAVIDAHNDYFEVEIMRIDREDIWVKIAQHLNIQQDPFEVILVQGLAKGEKMDTVLRQATELGFDEFVPTPMARSVVQLDAKKAQKRVERFKTIARNAAMQSGRYSIPEINEPQKLVSVIDRWTSDDVVLLFWEEAPIESTVNRTLRTWFEGKGSVSGTKIWIIVGPEGGIDPDEVEMIQESPAQVFTISLGPTILRTETAGVVSVALVVNELRDLIDRERS